MKRTLMMILALALAMGGTALADDAGEAGKSLSVRTFSFKYKQAENAATVIKPLMSTEGSMSMQPSTNALVVTDLPENMKKIAAALAEFDKAAQAFRLSVRLVSAARVAADQQPRIADDLRDLAPKLALLRYNSLAAVGSADVLGKEGEPGLIEMNGYRADFKFGEYDAASDSISLNDFRLSRHESDSVSPLMKTTLNLKLGQTFVISATRDPKSQRALMIVVSAKR